MLELLFTAGDLARTRFAISPLWDVVASVRVLKAPAEHPLHAAWVAQVRPRLAASGLDWGLLADLVPVPTRVIPAFVAPPPTTPVPDLELELAGLVAQPAARVHTSLTRVPRPHPASYADFFADPPGTLARLAGVIREYWELVLAPYWPRIQTMYQGDVLHRARRLAEGGADRLFADLDPNITWDTGTLRVAQRNVSGAPSLRGRGLLLLPSVFVWPRVFSLTLPPWQPLLRYPPRGIGTLWERDRRGAPEALAAVLGRSRALLLAELDEPAATTELARRTGLTASGVSQHLTALRAAGLVDAYRTGRFVLYARTAVAESLLTASA